eukprot:scaffold141973_cov31-Tisochrysis_lutea.AAC.6
MKCHTPIRVTCASGRLIAPRVDAGQSAATAPSETTRKPNGVAERFRTSVLRSTREGRARLGLGSDGDASNIKAHLGCGRGRPAAFGQHHAQVA